MNFPDNLKYTKDHEWIKISEGNIALVGITDYAQDKLSDIIFVELAPEGKELNADDVFGSVEAVKTVSELLSPVAGKILEINTSLSNKPELINSDPYGEAWMIKLAVTNLSDLDTLMDADAYKQIID